jgi:Family of unknown function (DUF6270)
MTRVAIVGSCITRDLWPVRGEALEGVFYVSRTSLPSLFAPPPAFEPDAGPPPGLTPFQHRALSADLAKTALERLVAFRPTHLIVDFIDERFDLLAAGDSLISDTWELETSGYLERPGLAGARVIPRLSEDCDRLWRRGAEAFAALVRATPLGEARLILHAARWATHMRSPDGAITPIRDVELKAGRPAEVGDHNRLLASYEEIFLGLMPPMARLEAAEHRLADASHQWGLSPFHYVPEYYAEIWRQLAPLGVTPAAWPSGPAG